MEVHAWVILTNHYHFLVHVNDFDLLGDVFRQVHGRYCLRMESRGKLRAAAKFGTFIAIGRCDLTGIFIAA